MFFANSRIVIGEGNGTPLQHSCLENPMGGGAWWTAVKWGLEESDMTERLTHIHTEMEIAELAPDRLLRVTIGYTDKHHNW